jgi:hypothetical protein
VEQADLCALAELMGRAVVLADVVCWEALEHRDGAAFSVGAQAAARLGEFGMCAGLLRA